MHTYLKELNTVQREAVENIKGPSLVIAGAGSGKTRVLTYRIAHLLRLGKKPSGILALTFTNKAAREMKDRIAKIVGSDVARYLWMGTFHSIFSRILRAEHKKIAYPSHFTIYDTVDSKNLIKTIIKELRLDPQNYKPGEVLGRISGAKNNLITARAYQQNDKIRAADIAMKRREVGRIYQIYAQRCFKAGAMDFDDLLLNTNILFRDNPDVLDKYRKKFNYILVDEYQDTNFSQYVIVKKLAQQHKNICVVGDDAQSIYAFRGAKIENILNFRNDYPEYRIFKLEQNYRSTQNIVEAANSIIQKNKNQITKKVFSKNEIGSKIKILDTFTDQEEGFLVANSISDIHTQENNRWDDFAVLYRTNAQSRVIEDALRKLSIPHKIVGGTSFYQRKEIKDMLAYFRLLVNPNDDEALKRIINFPKRGIGSVTVDRLEQAANQKDASIWKIILAIVNQQIQLNVNKGTQTKLRKFAELIIEYAKRLPYEDAYELAMDIASGTGVLKEFYNKNSIESISRYENIQELLKGIKEFSEQENQNQNVNTLDAYLQEVSLLTSEDKDNEDDDNKVVLMTIHSAKGLEFENVYIVGVEEGLFPSQFAVTTAADVEEERRLFYVAVTRAKRTLTISYAKNRFRWGSMQSSVPSRFVKDIDIHYLDMPDTQSDDYIDTEPEINETNIEGNPLKPTFKFNNKNKFSKKQNTVAKSKKPLVVDTKPQNKNLINYKDAKKNNDSEAISDSINFDEIQVGKQVEHDRFGYGVIEALEGKAPNIKATIEFKTSGKKKLLLKFAKLRIIT